MEENYLLNTTLARQLYHDTAKKLPVIDFHNHLCIADLAERRNYENLARLWLISDPYKHRAMRICGVAERYITGGADDYEKFQTWMAVLPKLIGNPLYDWSILEMERILGIELNPEAIDVQSVWKKANDLLSQSEYTAPGLLSLFNVEYAAPCASATEDISVFLKIDRIAPSLRGDDIVKPDKKTVEKLEELTGKTVNTREDYFAAVSVRLNDFQMAGCKFSDHALDDGFVFYADDGKSEKRFCRLLQENSLTEEEEGRLSSEILRFLASEYARRDWTMQLHIGAQRDTSSRLRSLAGPAGGFAGIGNCCSVRSLTRMLDNFEQGRYGLPRTILFTLNPADNAVMSVLSGSYSQDGVAGKVQQGPAWWWCDHLHGMREVFETISSFGVLSEFIGMTTDSRSILSFVRHEYFRRALCGWIAEKAAKGEMPASPELLKKLVEAVCYGNAKKLIEGGGK